MPNRVKQKIIT